MKRIFAFVFIICMLLQGHMAEAQTAQYEKYGRTALGIVQSDYPGEPVTDYQYQGRRDLGNGQVEDSFRFTVRERGQVKTVDVIVRHRVRDDKVTQVTIAERTPAPRP
ncbi:DUF3889 domain-containing protein [Peribacillus sp. SCS-155]|uniref:DUF3889 domain-containing protein n=1 Tax=Peribacillus sedimenti TaxID=3115297 RepID=UPI003905CD36